MQSIIPTHQSLVDSLLNWDAVLVAKLETARVDVIDCTLLGRRGAVICMLRIDCALLRRKVIVRVLGIDGGVSVSRSEEIWSGRLDKIVGVYRTMETRLDSSGGLGRFAKSGVALSRTYTGRCAWVDIGLIIISG